MTLCECGCGKETNIRRKKSNRFINGHNPSSKYWEGKHLSVDHKTKIGNSNIVSSTGKHPSQETKDKIARSHWKGGKIMSRRRRNFKRRQFGHIFLNECREDGWEGHHIDKDYVIFIPAKLHKSVWHAQKYSETMDIINDVVYEWFIKEYLGDKL